MTPPFYTISQTAAIAQVSRPTVERAIADGTLKAQRHGRNYVVMPDALNEWLQWRETYAGTWTPKQRQGRRRRVLTEAIKRIKAK